MATVLKIVVTGLAGVLLGLLVTIAALDPAAHGLAAGPWRGSPRDGTFEVDPYALARIDRSGTLPLGAAEGLRFIATTDSTGVPLDGACDYAVTGPIPAARFWSLGVLTPDGAPIANPAGRYGFTSAEVLRDTHDPVTITVSRQARAGNWLPVGHATAQTQSQADVQAFVMALHIYDTGLSAVGTTFDAAAMPTIRKLRCGS